MEMELLQKEQALQESSNDVNDWRQLPFLASNNFSLTLTDPVSTLCSLICKQI